MKAFSLFLFATVVLAIAARADEDSPERPKKAPAKAPDAKPDGKKDTAEPKPAPNPNRAPRFKLAGTDKENYTLEQFLGKWVVLEWINPGCPFVKKHYRIGHMQAIQKKYREKGVVWLCVCSTNPKHKDFRTPEQWQELIKSQGIAADAVLLDADGRVGRLYEARTTPQISVIDPKGIRVYDGAFDDAPRARKAEDIQAANNYVVWVLDLVLAGKPSPLRRTKPYGCSVKYAVKYAKKKRKKSAGQ